MGLAMSGSFQRFGEQRRMFAEWTDRIAAGAVPKQAPPRPSGVERNLVVTLWDWAVPTGGRSDGAASDDRIGNNNANGPIWGVIQSDDLLVSIDPAANRAEQIVIPTSGPMIGAYKVPSPYFPEQPIWQRKSDPRSVAIDHQGRVWLTGRIRAAAETAPFCKQGSTNKFTSYFPVLRPGSRQVMLYDPKTKQFAQIDTCFDADHNHFAHNAEQTLYFGQNNTLGWVDTAVYEKTKNAEASQGWCPAVVDTNGDGKITQWTEPEQPPDPAKDRRVTFGCYSVSVNEKDGGIWCAGIGPRDNKLVRIERGPDPPLTCKAEVFEPPPGRTPEVFRSGGVSVDSKGIVWLNWRGTDYMTSFDRSKCKTLNGPQATGQHCPEGWTVHIGTGPTFANTLAGQYAELLRPALPDARRQAQLAGTRARRAGQRLGQHRLAARVRPGHEPVRAAHRAVSDGLLRAISAGSGRQCADRLERAWILTPRIRAISRGTTKGARARSRSW